MTSVRKMHAFILTNRNGWAIPGSTNYTATQVRVWADKNFRPDGYDTAKKEGWRVRKILITDARDVVRP